MTLRRAVRSTVLVVLPVIMLVPLLTAATATAADEGELVLHDEGANGAITARIAESSPGQATLLVTNVNAFWTTVDVQTLGVDLSPASLIQGGGYAAAGVIAPGETAAWRATYNPARAAQVFIRTTPNISENETGRLAAFLTLLNIVIETFPQSAVAKSRIVADAALLRDIANQLNAVFGSEVSQMISFQELTSGRTGERIFAALRDPQQVEVILEAARLLGAKVTLDDAGRERLTSFIGFITILRTTVSLGVTLVRQSSSGGLLFAYDGPVAPPVAPVAPAGDLPQEFIGTWTGTVTQQRPPIPPTRIEVVISQGSRGSTVAVGSYPQLGCPYHWTLLSAGSKTVVVNEVVESGDCFTNVQVTLSDRGDGTLGYDFEDGNGQAVLTRR